MEKKRQKPSLRRSTRSITQSTTSYASTPSNFYVSTQSSLNKHLPPLPEQTDMHHYTDSVPQARLMSVNTVTYHSNILGAFEEEMEEVMPMEGMSDPLDAIMENRSILKGLSSPPPGQYGRSGPLEIEHYEVVGGWSQDAFGKQVYIERATIEEVNEEDEEEIIRALLPKPSSLNFLNDEGGSPMPWDMTDPLPDHTTPPPPPRPKVWNTFPVTPSVISPYQPGTAAQSPELPHLFGNMHAISNGHAIEYEESEEHTPPPWLVALEAQRDTRSSTGFEDLEGRAIRKTIEIIDEGLNNSMALRDWFIKLCKTHFLTAQVDATYRVHRALTAVKDAMNRRKTIPQSHWDLRSAEWHQKYETRLLSIQVSCQRLHAIRHYADSLARQPKEHHLPILLDKLLAHERKYTDLAQKLHASFDRLKLRHIHVMLVEAYTTEAEIQKSYADRAARKRESFFKKQVEAKVNREVLKKDYLEMKSSC